MTASRRVLLLPERRRFRGQPLSPSTGHLLGRADALPPADAGERAQLLRYFQLQPRGWPMAALLRQFNDADAGQAQWLRADPAYVRAEMTGARLMAWSTLGLSGEDADTLLAMLQPVFEAEGLALTRSAAEQWYLRLPADAALPDFSPPAEALGGQLLAHLPEGDGARLWRRLGTEAQILLHQHPLNAARAGRGLPPVNTLWFWGGGRLPRQVTASVSGVRGADDELSALALAAGIGSGEGVPAGAGAAGNAALLVDLRRERQLAGVEAELLQALHDRSDGVVLDFADGSGLRLARGQGWRWLRPAMKALDP
jgi:hypothetical protein